MRVYSNYTFRMYPNEEQKKVLDKFLNTSVFIYNYCLNYNDYLNKVKNKNIRYNDNKKIISKLKNDYPELNKIDTSIVLTSIELANDLYKKYVNCEIENIEYKNSDNYSFYMTINDNDDIIIDLDKNIISLPKINNIIIDIDCNLEKINDKIIRALIEKKDNIYYVSIYLENKTVVLKGLTDKVNKIVDEYNNLVEKLQRYEKRLYGLEQGLLRKEKGSNNYSKMLLKISKLERKIFGLKKDLIYFQERYFILKQKK